MSAVLAVAWGRVRDRVAGVKSPNLSRKTTVRPTRSAVRMRLVTRSTTSSSTASDSLRCNPPRGNDRCEPIERRRRPVTTRRSSWLLLMACKWRPEALPSMPIRFSSSVVATSRTWVIPRSRSRWAVTGPTPHSRSTGSGCRNSSSRPGSTTSKPSGLLTQLGCHDTARPNQAMQAGYVEECLVDREAFDLRCGVVKDVKNGLAGLAVGLHSRRYFDDRRAQSAGLAGAHCRAHADASGLVARGQNHATADHHRPISQRGVVSLLDRCIERVEISVQDGGGRCSHANTRSHTFATKASRQDLQSRR